MLNLPHIEQQRRDRALCTRIGRIACLLIIGFTGVSLRLYWLQCRQHTELTAAAAKLRLDKVTLPAKRGSIWDRNGELLAQDRTVYELHANVKHLNDPLHVRTRLAKIQGTSVPDLVRSTSEADIIATYRDHVVQAIAQRMSLPTSEIIAKLQAKVLVKSKDNNPAKDKLVEVIEPSLIKDLEKEEAEAWKQLLKDKRITGIYLRSSVKRFYPAADRLSHILGMVNYEKKGNEGVEQLLDQHLRGADGWETIERDAKKQNILPGFDGQLQEPRNGCHAVLTIDMTLQHMLEEKLLAEYQAHHSEKVMGVIIEPATGNILAMASIPLVQQQRDPRTGQLIDAYERRNGCHAVLTIDMTLQHMLEEKLLAEYQAHNPEKVMGVIIEPATGNILAMASIPLVQQQRDPKTGQLIDAYERRNMALTDCYEPGSTMKIITIAAALDAGTVDFDQAINCHSGYYQETIPNGNRSYTLRVEDDEAEHHQYLTVRNVLVHSSNVGAYMISKTLGRDLFRSHATSFGLGSISGLKMPRESSGILWPLDKWSGVTLSRIGMGYEIAVTPLQMAMAISAIANKGQLMQPRIVTHIITPDGHHQQQLPPTPVRQACKPDTAKKITEALIGVVTLGTGKLAAIEGIEVAGKTGTAQRFDPTNKHDPYPSGHHVVSFAGFAPAHAPQIACVIVIDDPKVAHNMQYGGKLAAPLFKDIVQTTLQHLESAPEKPSNLGIVSQ